MNRVLSLPLVLATLSVSACSGDSSGTSELETDGGGQSTADDAMTEDDDPDLIDDVASGAPGETGDDSAASNDDDGVAPGEDDGAPDEPSDSDTIIDDDLTGDDDAEVTDDDGADDDIATDDDAVSDDDAVGDDDVAPMADAAAPSDGGFEPDAAVPTGQPPVVVINHPGDGELRDPCPSEIPFIAVASDEEDGDLSSEIGWTSSIDGTFGEGPSFEACLSPGEHAIIARVVDRDGNVGEASISLEISGGGEGSGGNGSGGAGNGSGGADGGPPDDQATDDFERALLGDDWAVVFPMNGNQVQIVDDDLGMTAGPRGFFIVEWVGSAFSAEQYSQAILPSDVDPDWLHQVFVRRRSADGARYGFGYDGDPSQVNYGDWYFKYDGVAGSDTRMIATLAADEIPGPGATLRVEVQGFRLRGFFNGELVLEATDEDPTRIEDGRPGLAARWATGNGATSETVKVYESWSGGSL